MAASEQPTWQPPTRRSHRASRQSLPEPGPDSRAERNRERRERSMERQFTWLFAVAVAATTLYLVSRTPWGWSLIQGHF